MNTTTTLNSADKKIKGRKRHILVEILGLLLAVAGTNIVTTQVAGIVALSAAVSFISLQFTSLLG
jgi:hypothetical protein